MRLLQLCFDLMASTKGKFPELQNEQVQRIIKMDEKTLVKRFAEFINAGCRIGLLGIIDLSAPTTLNFRGGIETVDQSTGGPTGYHKFADLKVKAVSKLLPGEVSITGTDFLFRLCTDGEVPVHANFIEYVMNNIHDEDVQAFLKKNSMEITNLYGKYLYAFGDRFQEPGNWPQYVWALRQEKERWKDYTSYMTDSFDENHLALVFE